MSDNERYFRLFLIWLRKPKIFERYQREVAPVAARYGGIERSLAPRQILGTDLTMPDIVNIVYFRTMASAAALHDDPQFQAVVPLRSASVDLAFVDGVMDGVVDAGDTTETGVADRRYLVELARFGEAGEAGYRAYEQEAGPFMAKFSYHVERVIRPDRDAVGLPFQPDLVKVAYFDSDADMDRMQQDPDHARFEGELYNRAVAESLWLFARARVR
jgi:uncharacterized protein (DUF1330 family)